MNHLKKALLIFFCLLFMMTFSTVSAEKIDHYYCTVADERHFPIVMSLIGSIHQVDFDELDEIAVFDIGLTEEQRETLGQIQKVKVCEIEKVHPDLCTYFTTTHEGRTIRGWFAWKPVIFKQALERYPYFLYVDAGSLFLNSPGNLFKHIKQNGYFLITLAPHPIEERITEPVIEKVLPMFTQEQQKFLRSPDAHMIDAGLQGISRQIEASYVSPMYKLAFDLTVFEDDGSAKHGFGQGRHDQTLFSLFANLLKFTLHPQGHCMLQVEGKAVPFHMHWDRSLITSQTCIYRSRADHLFAGDKTVFIHWKPK